MPELYLILIHGHCRELPANIIANPIKFWKDKDQLRKIEAREYLAEVPLKQ
jgi:hypothetical protein